MRTTNGRRGGRLLLALAIAGLGAPGCLSARLLERSRETRPAAASPPRPLALLRAARTADGAIHVETRFQVAGSEQVRHHRLPLGRPPTDGRWQPAGPLDDPVARVLEAARGPWPAAAAPLPLEPDADAGLWVRLRAGCLELRGADGELRLVGAYPVARRPAPDARTWSSRSLGLAVALPFALLCDAGLLLLGATAFPVSLALLAAAP